VATTGGLNSVLPGHQTRASLRGGVLLSEPSAQSVDLLLRLAETRLSGLDGGLVGGH